MLPTRVGNILGVSGGTIYDDFVTFSEKGLSEPSIVTYAFTYDKDMCIGSIIKLNLPAVHGFTVPKLSDELVSGNWLITGLDHVTDGQDFESSFNCIKVGFKKGFRKTGAVR